MSNRKSKEEATVSDAVSEIFEISDKFHDNLEKVDIGLTSVFVLSIFMIFIYMVFGGFIFIRYLPPINSDTIFYLGIGGFFVLLFSTLGFKAVYSSYFRYQAFKKKLDTIVRFRRFNLSPDLPQGKTPKDRMVEFLLEEDERFEEAMTIYEKKKIRKKALTPSFLKGTSGKEYHYSYILINNETGDYFIINEMKEKVTFKDINRIRKEVDDIIKNRRIVPLRIVIIQQGNDIEEDVIREIDINWIQRKNDEVPIEVITETLDKQYNFGLLYFP